MTRSPRVAAILAILAVVLGGATAARAAPAGSVQLEADKEALMACVGEAFPEGEFPGAPAKRTFGGDCIGLIARSTEPPCAPSAGCARRETAAWLAIARDLEAERRPQLNAAAVKAAVVGIERQARAICNAAAAASAWGGDDVAKGRYRLPADSDCLRDAVAGMVVPLMGHLRGN